MANLDGNFFSVPGRGWAGGEKGVPHYLANPVYGWCASYCVGIAEAFPQPPPPLVPSLHPPLPSGILALCSANSPIPGSQKQLCWPMGCSFVCGPIAIGARSTASPAGSSSLHPSCPGGSPSLHHDCFGSCPCFLLAAAASIIRTSMAPVIRQMPPNGLL